VRAAVYSRFSTDRRNESSIADQVRVCTEYANSRGWQVAGHFEDQGISGAALGNRPGVLKLQDAAFAGRFNAVLVTDLSRLSRSQGDLSKIIDRLVAKGIRVVGVQDGYDSSRRGHKLQAGVPTDTEAGRSIRARLTSYEKYSVALLTARVAELLLPS
jgi:DNA invertase Pin-like site-specific DNA recombinase